MTDSGNMVALCCYKYRVVVLDRCDHCKAEYACPGFTTTAAVVEFNAIIPPSMLSSPLPIELWPNMGADPAIERSLAADTHGSSDYLECRLRRLVSALRLNPSPLRS